MPHATRVRGGIEALPRAENRCMKVLHRFLLAGLLCMASAAQAIVFDASLGLPGTQGWTTLSIGTTGTASVSGNLLSTDSTGLGVDTWGFSRFSPAALDPQGGYTVNFGLRMLQEQHSNDNRSGFSMLFVGSEPTQSIELSFRTNEVLAYQYVNGAFELNYRALFAAEATVHSYTLNVANGLFVLSAGGNSLISGSLQNYTPQGLPYNLAGFMFFGDNTSSGSSLAQVAYIDVISSVPEPGIVWTLLAGLGVVLLRWRARR
jgi:hypothetical protein